MILVDTSVWIETFRSRRPLDLQAVVDFDDIATCLPVIQEVLQGFRDEYVDDIRSHEISATGYSADGVTLSSKSATYTGASNKSVLDAADPAWTGATFTVGSGAPRYCAVWKDTGGADSTCPLLGYGDFGSEVGVTAGTFTVQFDSTNGVLLGTVQVA